MKKKNYIILLVVLTLGLFSQNFAHTQAASQSSASQVGPVTKVMFKNGYFEKNSAGGWDEYYNNGQLRFPFKEVHTTRDSVFLRNDTLMVDLELNMAKGEIWGEWPGQFRHKMHKITNVENNAPAPPSVSEPENGVRINMIEYSGGTLKPMSDIEWADYRNDSDAVHLYDVLSSGSEALYLYSDSSNRLYRADLSAQILYMAANGGPMNFHSAINGMSGVSANPPSIPAPPQPQLPGTMSQAERDACAAEGRIVERAGMMGAERCTKPYSDGGKPCADSTQCDGLCRAPSDKEMGDVSLGVCQMNDNPFGCHAEIRNGIVEPTLCVD